MKMRSLLFASMMLGVSLSAADFCPLGGVGNVSALGQCPADLALVSAIPDGAKMVCDALGKCSFDATTNPAIVEEVVSTAFEQLADGGAGVGVVSNDSLMAHAFGILQQALTYAQETGNDYLGEYIRDGLVMIQEQYEENPVTTVVVGTVATVTAVVTTFYVLRGCVRLMKRCASFCYRHACKSKRGPVVRAHAADTE